MNPKAINKLLKFCSVLDSQNQFEKSDKVFRIATNILAQSTKSNTGYDPQNPLFTYTDPTNVERSEGIPGSGTIFLENDLLSILPGVPDRFKNIKMQDFTAWFANLIPAFDPNNLETITEFRTRIIPALIRKDPQLWSDLKELMKVFNAFIMEKSLPEKITGDPKVDKDIKDGFKKTYSDIVGSPVFSIINDVLNKDLIQN